MASDLARASSDLFWETDTESRFTRIWGAGIDLTDGEQNALGRTRWEIAGADIESDENWRAHLEVVRAHQPFRDFVFRNQRATGEVDYWSSGAVPFFDAAGRFAGYRGVGKVVTARILAETALRESEAKWSGMLSISPDAIIACDESQRIVVFNQGAENLFDYGAAEIVGRPLETLLPERFRSGHREHLKTFSQSDTASRLMNERGEISARKKDGNEFPAEASISKLELGGEILFTVMLHDVTSRKETEIDILQAKEAAEIADRAKSEFLANMSHELRTPLNAIMGFAEIIKDQHLEAEVSERYREYAGYIYDSGNHLLSIINDILDISKIEAGKVELEDEEIDLQELCDSAKALVEGRAEEAGISIVFNAEFPAVKLLAKKITPNIVEYHAGSNDMTRSKDRNVVVSANATVEAGAHHSRRVVRSTSPVSSCLTERFQ